MSFDADAALERAERARPHLRYVHGDATKPLGSGPRVIVHCCNDVGAWGAGFVVALSNRWDEPEIRYRSLRPDELFLGYVQFVQVTPSICVANLIGQHGVGPDRMGIPPIRYSAIVDGLARVRNWVWDRKASVHMPRMGAGLAGGDWSRIERIIVDELTSFGVDVTVYDLPPVT